MSDNVAGNSLAVWHKRKICVCVRSCVRVSNSKRATRDACADWLGTETALRSSSRLMAKNICLSGGYVCVFSALCQRPPSAQSCLDQSFQGRANTHTPSQPARAGGMRLKCQRTIRTPTPNPSHVPHTMRHPT